MEAEGSACLAAALRAGRRVRLAFDSLDLFADGVSVAQVGREPFRIARTCVDGVITASVDEICAAVKDVFDDTRSIAEPAGALAVAGLKKYAARRTSDRARRYVAVISGANVNFDRLRHISERAELGEYREAIFGVTIDETRGSFRRFCRSLGKRSVTEFNYRFAGDDQAHVYVGLQMNPGENRQVVADDLAAAGYRVSDMTDNETAKLHVRHMVGGRTFGSKPELLFRFEFPERPGALLRFLNGLGSSWNITMFHYRFSSRCACQSSQSVWSPIQNSAVVPNNVPSRRAARAVMPRLPFTSSFTRLTGRSIRRAASAWLMLLGFRNSSINISPGCGGGAFFGKPVSGISPGRRVRFGMIDSLSDSPRSAPCRRGPP